MSSLIPSGSASGTGSMTLAAPVTNSNQTVTIPDATGTVMVSGNMPAFSAYQSSAQSISGSTYTKLQFQTEEFDTNNNFDSSTNYRFTPTVAGYYQLTGGFNGTANVTSGQLLVYKNGSQFKYLANPGGGTNAGGVWGTVLVYANGSTDYFEMWGYTTTGQNANASSQLTYFQGCMVRSA